MAKTTIDLPPQFNFSTFIPIRITDLNYGGHVGNDTVLSIIHEARVQFLHSYGYQELNMAGAGLIMSNVTIEFKSELFYGDIIETFVVAANFTGAGFDVYYKLLKDSGNQKVLIAIAKTGMICYDYEKKKIVAVPDEAKSRLML